MRNGSPTIVIVYTNSYAAITKILNLKMRSGGGAIRDFIYQNVLIIRNDGHILVLQ